MVREQNYVGPTVGKELIKNAFWALIIGSGLIMIYVLARFGRWQMSIAAILSLVHDVAFVLAFSALLQLEINASFIAVILTIIGYSINDTIIVFDRIRENARNLGDDVNFAQLCNLSMSQTWLRSINTVLTVVFMILVLLVVRRREPARLHGGDADRHHLRLLQLDLHRHAADAVVQPRLDEAGRRRRARGGGAVSVD